MPLQVKRNGAWVTPGSGTVRVKSNGQWVLATGLQVRSGGQWQNSGYVGFPSAPTNFRSTNNGTGTNKTVSFAWNAPVGGAPVTNYRFRTYNSSQQEISSVDLSSSTLSRNHTFTGNAGAVFFADVAAIGTAGESARSNRLRITLGNPATTTYTGGWSTNIEYHNAVGVDASSYWNANENPVGFIGDMDIFTSWLSGGHAVPNDALCYEGVNCITTTSGQVNGKYRKFVSVRYLGNHEGSVWVGYFYPPFFSWAGPQVLSGVQGQTAGFVQHNYLHVVGTPVYAPDVFGLPWLRVDLPADQQPEVIGTPGEVVGVTFGPDLAYSPGGAAWSSFTRYRAECAEIQIGTRFWDPSLGAVTVPATANTVVAA